MRSITDLTLRYTVFVRHWFRMLSLQFADLVVDNVIQVICCICQSIRIKIVLNCSQNYLFYKVKTRWNSNGLMAERGGFEPPHGYYPPAGIRSQSLQPLGYLSTYFVLTRGDYCSTVGIGITRIMECDSITFFVHFLCAILWSS